MYKESCMNTYSTNYRDIRSFLGFPEDYPLYKMVDAIIAYLRKSRHDLELYGNEAVEETLARHEKTIQEWAISVFGVPIPEENIRREVVSGETLDGRPEMQNVLKSIEGDEYRAIVCVDVQRLGRGDLEDQGKIMKMIRYSDTKILTPNQWFDLSNNHDRKFFENKMRESKEYLDYAKDVLRAGRLRSVLDGKYPHSVPPFGFKRVKLTKEKGYTLEYEEREYKICRLIVTVLTSGLDIFYEIKENDTWSTVLKTFGIKKKNILKYNKDFEFKIGNKLRIKENNPGTSVIANYLNYLGIMPRNSKIWTAAMIRNVLMAPAAHGFVTWDYRKTVSQLKKGKIVKNRPVNKSDSVFIKGRWNPIFTPEESEKIKKILTDNSTPKYNKGETKSPLAGLIICDMCGHKMQRRNYYPKTHTKRIYDIDKEELQIFLRGKKGNKSLTEISRETHISRNTICNIFTPSKNRFAIPRPEHWSILKSCLNLGETKFDAAITTVQVSEETRLDTLLCNHKTCKNVSSNLVLVENKIIESLKEILRDYTNYVKNYSKKLEEENKANAITMEIIEKEIIKVENKLNKICELLEDGTYTKDLFNERKRKLDIELKELKNRKKTILNSNVNKKYNNRKKMIPEIQRVLDTYNSDMDVEEKNKLLSSIIEKVHYRKEKGGRNLMENFQLKIFLKI